MARRYFNAWEKRMLRANLLAIATIATSTVTTAYAAQPPAPDVIGLLGKITTIGSTIDPHNGDRNPYGLTIAPASGGSIAAGDLVVCNFNDAFNIQGLGTSVEVLKPVAGARPKRLIADARLTGCAAIAMGGAAPWIAALDANDNPIVSPQGAIADPINNFPWTGPWGQAFVAGPKSPPAFVAGPKSPPAFVAGPKSPPAFVAGPKSPPAFVAGPKNPPAFYESNANDGSIVRINLTTPFTFDKIATGLPVNHGVPGNILAPSGLTYDSARDVLYVVDGAVNVVAAIHGPATIPAGGIVVHGKDVEGRYASRVKIVHYGAPLNAPISAALLFNGDLVVGNTGDNRLVELSPEGRVVSARVLDTGAPGALFGIAAAATSTKTTQIFFNDDNDNTVKVLTR